MTALTLTAVMTLMTLMMLMTSASQLEADATAHPFARRLGRVVESVAPTPRQLHPLGGPDAFRESRAPAPGPR